MLLIGRLGARDLRHRPVQAALPLLLITAATTTLILGLACTGRSPASRCSFISTIAAVCRAMISAPGRRALP
jgi:predicted acyltransferase